MKAIFIMVILYIELLSSIWASEIKLKGQWSSEKYQAKKDVPSRSFSIQLQIDSQNHVEGEICSITRYGNKIDCPIYFSSQWDGNKIPIIFDSHFGGKNGVGVVTFHRCELNWSLIKKPEGESYLEMDSILLPNKISVNKMFSECTDIDMSNHRSIIKKARLFELNKESSSMVKSKMYLIKGDKVNLLQKQNDFYQIEYQSAKKGKIRKWIHCSAIDAC